MCTIPPPPPPPAPPIPHIDLPTKVSKNGDNNELNFHPDKCMWASEYPELRETCFRNDICCERAPFKFQYRHFDSILQIGPTCGIVAVSMLVNGTYQTIFNGKVSPDGLLDIAKLEGYTCNGEMFSCKHMVKLAKTALNLVKAENIRCTLKLGGLFSSDTIERLLNGAVLLVPYDADCNHSPCLRNGHTAHWAIICGILIDNDPGESYNTDPSNVYVLCKHGKSKYLAAWKLHDLAKSNSNLQEFSPKKVADGLTYILPEGGIGGENGLRDQFLIFEGFDELNTQ